MEAVLFGLAVVVFAGYILYKKVPKVREVVRDFFLIK